MGYNYTTENIATSLDKCISFSDYLEDVKNTVNSLKKELFKNKIKKNI